MNVRIEPLPKQIAADEPPRNPAVWLHARSWCALAVVAGLLVFHQLLLQPALIRMASDAPVINIAGRQRMLSQKLAKTALELQAAESADQRRASRDELATVVTEWTRAHRGLQTGDSARQLRGLDSVAIQTAFAEIDPHYQAMRTAAETLLTSSQLVERGLSGHERHVVATILRHEGPFLDLMHRIVGQYEREARLRVWQLQGLGWGIVAAILTMLLAIQWLIIRPAVQVVASRVASSEARYSRLVESMTEGLVVHDAEGRVQFANRRFGELVGHAADQLRGLYASLFVADADRQRYEQLICDNSPSGEPVELALRGADGALIETMASTQPLFDEQGNRQGCLLVVTDITARRQAEQRTRELLEQLAHADRLKSMGELAAGLAHELNQPLAAIANFAEGSLATLQTGSLSLDDMREPLRRILSAALRGGEIIRRSRRFSQRRGHEVRPESVNELIRDIEHLCRPEALRREISLEVTLAAELPLVPVDGIQVQQVVVNLVQNAFAALEQTPAWRRRLTIATEQSSADFVRVLVSDSGPGLGDQDPAQLFEPFVTTRGDGLGLGLAISRGIVEAHGGTISVATNHDGGATFSFTLPTQPLAASVVNSSMRGAALYV